MGSCVSCQASKSKKKKDVSETGSVQLTKSEMQEMLLRSILRDVEDSQMRDELVKSQDESPNPDAGNEEEPIDSLQKSFEQLHVEKLNFPTEPEKKEIENSEKSEDRKISRETKRKRAKLEEEEINHDEESEESNLHHKATKAESSIEEPLTIDEILEVLSSHEKNENSLSPDSLHSSSLLPDKLQLSPYQDLTFWFEDINEATHIAELANSNLVKRPPAISDPSSNYTQFSVNQVLNQVPAAYDDFKKTRSFTTGSEGLSSSFSVDSVSTSETTQLSTRTPTNEKSPITSITSALTKIDKHNQNILHRMVLSRDLDGAATVLHALTELGHGAPNAVTQFLDALDDLLNPPISYAILLGQVEMVCLLLRYRPILSSVCFLNENNWIPTLHIALKFWNPGSGRTSESAILLETLCDHLITLGNRNILLDFLETRDKDDLSLIHRAILDFYPVEFKGHKSRFRSHSDLLEYLLSIGASAESKCCCVRNSRLQVDAIGQALFCNYPIETIQSITTSSHVQLANIQTTYSFSSQILHLHDFVSWRTDLSLEKAEKLRCLLDVFC